MTNKALSKINLTALGVAAVGSLLVPGLNIAEAIILGAVFYVAPAYGFSELVEWIYEKVSFDARFKKTVRQILKEGPGYYKTELSYGKFLRSFMSDESVKEIQKTDPNDYFYLPST